MAQTLEDRIKKVIEEYEKKNKVVVEEVTAIRKRPVGFGSKEEIKVTFYER